MGRADNRNSPKMKQKKARRKKKDRQKRERIAKGEARGKSAK